jgi:hypothetical protein
LHNSQSIQYQHLHIFIIWHSVYTTLLSTSMCYVFILLLPVVVLVPRSEETARVVEVWSLCQQPTDRYCSTSVVATLVLGVEKQRDDTTTPFIS